MLDLPPHQETDVTSKDVTIHVRRFGAPGATPILIVHGLSYFSYDWIGVATALSNDREVAAIDMRGFGDSSWSPSQDYGLEAFAGDISAVMDAFGWNKVILAGHSMGGRNSTYFAARNPGKVEKLVLVDYSPVNAKEGGQRVARTVAGVPDAFPDVDAALNYFGKDSADPKVRARMEAYLRPIEGGFAIKRDTFFRDRFKHQLETGEKPKLGADMWEELARVSSPILVVRGTRSDMFARETADKVATVNSRLSLVEVDAGHDVGGDVPDALVKHIKNFLD